MMLDLIALIVSIHDLLRISQIYKFINSNKKGKKTRKFGLSSQLCRIIMVACSCNLVVSNLTLVARLVRFR